MFLSCAKQLKKLLASHDEAVTELNVLCNHMCFCICHI
jgi:hypothetical protein